MRKNLHKRPKNRRPNLYRLGRSLRYETMEGRLVLSASGFTGNECAPELDDAELDAIVPNTAFSPQSEIAFSFSAADVVVDEGEGATPVEEIRFVLDPDIGIRNTGATPEGASLVLNDQGTTETSDDLWEFSWTPTASQVGTFRLFLIATDDGGTANVPLSDVFAFNLTVDNRPSVDLNGADESGIDFGPVSFVEADDSVPVSIVDSDLTIPFASGGTIQSATVEIASPQEGGVEVLAVTADSSLVVDTSVNGRLVITVDGGGLADKSLFEEALRSLTYNNTSDAPEATRTISVVVNDGLATSDAATTTVNIENTNDRPDLQTITDAGPARVGEELVLDLVATDPDGADLLVFRITDGPEGAVISPNGLPDNSADNTIQVTPDSSGFYRATIRWTPTQDQGLAEFASFTVVATDAAGLSDPELYEIEIENQAPTANDDPETLAEPIVVSEDAESAVVVNILANDSDPEGEGLTVSSVTAGGSSFTVGTAFTHPTSGAVILVSENGQVEYDPNGQFELLSVGDVALDSFTYTARDSSGNESGSATVTFNIEGENDAPTNNGTVPEFRIDEGEPSSELALATLLTGVDDVDVNDSYTVMSAPDNPAAGGSFLLDGGVLSFEQSEGEFDLSPGAEETIDFEVVIEDSGGESVSVPARIVIVGVNNAPVVAALSGNIGEDTFLEQATREVGLLATATDDGDIANLSVVEVNGSAANVGVTLTLPDGAGHIADVVVNDDGSYSIDPRAGFDSLAAGQTSNISFSYRASDGETVNDLSNEATVSFTITGLNDAPSATDVTAAAQANGGAVTESFAGSDPDSGDTIDFEIVTPPAEGSVVNNDDGTFSFDPLDDFDDLIAGATRDATFTFRAIDAALAESAEATATITVTGVNDAPEFNLSDTDGLASLLPTGEQQDEQTVMVTLDIESTNQDIRNLNAIDLDSIVSDVDGDNVVLSLVDGNNGGTPFRAGNRPVLNASNELSWTPTSQDLGTGYVIRVLAQDQPTQGSPISKTFDLVVDVVQGHPVVESVSALDLSAVDSEITILFSEALGTAGETESNYAFTVVGGGFNGEQIGALTATASGNAIVVAISKTTLTNVVSNGATSLRLTLLATLVDSDGHGIIGPSEFDVEFIST